MTDFLAAVLAKTLFIMLEALIMRLVQNLFLANLRQQPRPATMAALTI